MQVQELNDQRRRSIVHWFENHARGALSLGQKHTLPFGPGTRQAVRELMKVTEPAELELLLMPHLEAFVSDRPTHGKCWHRYLFALDARLRLSKDADAIEKCKFRYTIGGIRGAKRAALDLMSNDRQLAYANRPKQRKLHLNSFIHEIERSVMSGNTAIQCADSTCSTTAAEMKKPELVRFVLDLALLPEVANHGFPVSKKAKYAHPDR